MDAKRRYLISKVFVSGGLLYLVILLTAAVGSYAFLQFKIKTIQARVAQNEFYHVRVNNEQIANIFSDAIFDLFIMRSHLGENKLVNNEWNNKAITDDFWPMIKFKPRYRAVAFGRAADDKWLYLVQGEMQNIDRRKIVGADSDLAQLADRNVLIQGVQIRKDETTHEDSPISYLITAWEDPVSKQKIYMALEYSLEHISDLLEKIFVPHLGTTLFVDQASGVLFVPIASAEALNLGSVGSYLRFVDIFPEESARMSHDGSGQLDTDRGLFTFATVFPLPNNFVNASGRAEINIDNQVIRVYCSSWKNISFVPRELLTAEVRSEQKTVWSMFAIAGGVLFFLFAFLIKIQSERLWARHELAFERERSFHQSKMATIGEMASGIAHEINNPLAIIVWYCDAIKEMLETPPIEPANLSTIVDDIKSAAFRVSKIIKSMRAVARDAEQDPFVLTNINNVLDDTMVLSNKKVKDAQVALKMIKASNDEMKIECRPAELSQVILNLINNACDALESVKDRWVQVEVKDKGDDVCIEISDSGPGIPPEVRAKIFNPFFTTKATGKGTGLGLSISQRIVEGHRGTLELLTNTPQTTFLIRIPKAQAAPLKKSG